MTEPALGVGTADCEVVIRFENRIYVSDGFTGKVGQPVGTADLSACDDTGAHARGAYFPEDPRQVTVWAIPGTDVEGQVAIEYSDSQYRVVSLTGEE